MSTDRVQRWCNRLLDMSARNRLLNLPKSDRQLIEIDCPDLGRLETLLADMRGGGRAKPLRFCPSPGLMDKDDPRHRDLHRDRHGDDAAKTFALETLTRGELLFWRREDTLQTALIEIYRQARAAEKGGRDQHFQATIGFDLDGPQQGKPSLAPLSLIPVTQERPSSKFPLQSLGLTPARSA
ncbi:DUF4011 domain-containing protein [Lichenicoccus roseus]|uniref:DUF4011 domain-containing protein n=1 Tax=Lichenicoccus roseus TaxID=2683649 RepID=UPI001F102F70|nr:DUF4011 domain-containing protein [Lichenicoccus roseus]